MNRALFFFEKIEGRENDNDNGMEVYPVTRIRTWFPDLCRTEPHLLKTKKKSSLLIRSTRVTCRPRAPEAAT